MNRRKGVDDSSDDEDVPQHAASPEPAPTASTSTDAPADATSDHSNAASEGEGEAADSSEDDSSDDAEELARIREGFIADSDEDETPKQRRRRKRHHRAPSDEEENLELDEDDLDLVREASGGPVRDENNSRFKRLKKAGDSREAGRRGLNAMFDDDDENEDEEERPAPTSRRGEFDDFIEADEFSEDEEERLRREEERETGNRRAVAAAPGLGAVSADLAGLDLDEDKLGEIYDVFGDGDMYDWALAGEEDMEAAEAPAEDLAEVFEPSELAARMLTAEDNQIRVEDLPERFQLLRARLRSVYDLGDDADYFEKKQWVAETFLEAKNPPAEFRELTRQAVQHVVDFMALENLEVPFIWHHRQDYLVHFSDTTADAVRTQLLTQDDLWKIIDFDMDYHALLEKRRAARDLATQVQADTNPEFIEVETAAETATDFQDLLEWLQFVHSAALRQTRRHSRFGTYDRVRAGSTMELVDAMQLNPAKVAQALESKSGSVVTGRDSALTPAELAGELKASVKDAEDYCSAAIMFDPRIRRWFRRQFELRARVDIVVTDDGRRKIDANSPYADIKYAANWTLEELRMRPALFLRMLQAEELGLVIVRVQFPNYKTSLYADFEETCGGSADTESEWALMRRSIAKTASRRIVPLITRGILDALRSGCTRSLRDDVRRAFLERIDQAPFKPAGYVIGTVPRVLAVTSGEANFTDAVIAVVVDEDGRLTEVSKLGDARASDFRRSLADLAEKVRPDVVGVAGFTPASRKLFQSVQQAIEESQVQTGPEDAEEPLQVLWVKDDVARLYRNSQKAANEFPELVANARYCVALARYLQSPLLEHASLDSEQLSALPVHPHQSLLPDDDFTWALETAFVDIVCLEGVDINLAVRSEYHASVLRYVAGLGPRKASSVLQAILARAQGQVASRTQLVTAEITSKTVFMNCAAFLKIPWSSDGEEYLDATRVHPEDYDLARKMAADAQELDEEDIEAIEERRAGGVVYQLLEDDPHGRKLEDLVLEEYAEELESLFKQRKRCTLDHIRREIQEAYRELRKPLRMMSVDDVFTMLTGETRAGLGAGTVCSAIVRRVTGRQLVLVLDSGVDAVAESGSISDDRSVPLNQQFAPGQAVQAAVQSVDYANLFASVSTRQAAVVDAQRQLEASASNHDPQHWNQAAEDRDTDAVRRRTEQTQRQMRVIKHPLFRPISAKEAEAFLAPLQRGDLVIRPSSRGMDHLVVTWKVAEQIYQHIDVKELDKPNEYALGRSLQVGPYRYSDLDELIIMHVQSMARKVDEMTQSDKFQKGNKADVAKWLTAYTNARPNQSVYAFCFDHRRPGYFLLCFMLGANSPIKEVHVKLLPNGYELMRNAYADVQGLCNGFKIMVQRSRA